MHFGKITPVLRIFDEGMAREFYVDFLGFEVDWEHRAAEDLPLYAGISRDGCELHLSGHFGDAIPGSRVRIKCDDLDLLCEELVAKEYKHARPQVEEVAWGREVAITDPFGNRLIFCD